MPVSTAHIHPGRRSLRAFSVLYILIVCQPLSWALQIREETVPNNDFSHKEIQHSQCTVNNSQIILATSYTYPARIENSISTYLKSASLLKHPVSVYDITMFQDHKPTSFLTSELSPSPLISFLDVGASRNICINKAQSIKRIQRTR